MKEYRRKSRKDRMDEIHRSAIRLFLQKGYSNTTMEDIVNATTLSKGGLYHYYGSTKEIIFDIMDQGNMNFLTKLKVDPSWTKEELCNYLTEKIVEKSLVPTSERRLYLMFCMEALYDEDFEILYKKLEGEALAYLSKCMQSCENVHFHAGDDMVVISKIMNGFLFVQNLFSDSETLLSNRTLIYDIFYKILISMFTDV